MLLHTFAPVDGGDEAAMAQLTGGLVASWIFDAIVVLLLAVIAVSVIRTHRKVAALLATQPQQSTPTPPHHDPHRSTVH
jgi:hypothetical protein